MGWAACLGESMLLWQKNHGHVRRLPTNNVVRAVMFFFVLSFFHFLCFSDFSSFFLALFFCHVFFLFSFFGRSTRKNSRKVSIANTTVFLVGKNSIFGPPRTGGMSRMAHLKATPAFIFSIFYCFFSLFSFLLFLFRKGPFEGDPALMFFISLFSFL